MILELHKSNIPYDELKKKHNEEIRYLGLSDSGLEFFVGGHNETLPSSQIKNVLGNFHVEIISYSDELIVINFISELIPSD